MKKVLKYKPVLFLGLLSVVFIISGTFAYYYDEVIFPNRFKTMTYKVDVEEEFNNEFGTKKVYFVNKEATNVSVVLRFNYNEVWKNGTEIVSNVVNGNNVVNKNWTTAFQNDFIQGNDGWYYYKKVLNAGERVQVLESIALNNNSYSNYDYDLSFNYEAIQANKDAVSDIWNKTISINGSDIIWNL